MSEAFRLGARLGGDAEVQSGHEEESDNSYTALEASSERAVLADWSAEEFAKIYTLYRHHLVQQARSLLQDIHEAEDVVQEAFLYVMTSLPELDSELGVLRFLRWKTRMLCIDRLRSQRAALPLDSWPKPEEVESGDEPSDFLNRADDAAIVRLALAKLSPRHRQILIETIYEEKSYEEISQQLGLSSNAFRQLLFRARAAFKAALVGEADTAGMSVSQILSIGSRRLRDSAKSAGAMKSAVVLLVSLAFVAPMWRSSVSEPYAASPTPIIHEHRGSQEGLAGGVDYSDSPAKPFATGSGLDESPSTDVSPARVITNDGQLVGLSENPGKSSPAQSTDSQRTLDEYSSVISVSDLKNFVLEPLASSTLKFSHEQTLLSSVDEDKKLIYVRESEFLAVSIGVVHGQRIGVDFLTIQLAGEGRSVFGVPRTLSTEHAEVNGLTVLRIGATDFSVGDFSGEFDFTTAELSNSLYIVVELTYAAEFEVTNVVLTTSLREGPEITPGNSVLSP